MFQDWELLRALRSSLVTRLQHLETPPTQCGFYISFYFFPPGTGNTQHQLFYYYLGRGGDDFIVWGFFLKMKNKKLYIIYIYILYMKHTLLHRLDDKGQFLK